MQENLIIKEEVYEKVMRTDAEPYLEKRLQVMELEREKGKKIHCVWYRAENPRGVVVISHGFTESAEKYKEIIYYFVQEQYHVYMPEHCGHGNSYRLTEDLSLVHIDDFQRYVDDLLYVASVAKRQNSGLHLYLYAHSMGGGIGAAAAAKDSHLFSKIILTSPMIRPLTGKVPWKMACMMAKLVCIIGKEMSYVSGHPYDGTETFEDSCSLSRVRFDYYQKKRKIHPELQMNGASYGWLKEAGKLNQYLHKVAVKNIKAPLLLFQAEKEDVVSKKEQNRFVQELKAEGTDAKLVIIKDAKHEIFNATDAVLELYWKMIFDYFAEF